MKSTNEPRLCRPQMDDAAPLLAFELGNRAYFEQWINARAASYYSIEGVAQAIEAAQRDSRADLAHQFLVKVGADIVGRVNLTALERTYYNKALLGYRIGADFGGRGYASKAVQLALREGFDKLGLWRIEASVRALNPASIRVVERNGFSRFGSTRRSMLLHGAWYDVHHFECRRDERA